MCLSTPTSLLETLVSNDSTNNVVSTTIVYPKFVNFWIPQNINIDLINSLNNNGNKFDLTISDLNKCLYVINHVANYYYYKPHKKSNNEFVPVSSNVLKKNFNSKKVKSILNFLVDEGFLYIKSGYKPNKITRRFKFTARYSNLVLVNYQCRDRWIVKKVFKFKSQDFKQVPNLVEYSFLKKSLDTVSFDVQSALNDIQSKFHNKEYVLKTKSGKQELYTLERYISANNVILRLENEINTKNFDFNVSKTNDRLYTTLTSLPTYLKKYVTINGQKIVGLDLSNSQPFFLNILLDEYKRENPSSVNQKLIDECELYKSETENGLLYKTLKSNCIQYNNLNLPTSKKTFDNIKTEFFTNLFFSKLKLCNGSTIYKVFSNQYPEILKIINYYKSVKNENFAVQLQKIESRVFINNICKNIFEILGNIPVFTIHDAIYCSVNDENNVRQIIKAVFNEIGYNPTIKREVY